MALPAYAITEGADAAIAALLDLYPELHTAPIAAEGGLTALHIAARSGTLPVLPGLFDVAELPAILPSDATCLVLPSLSCLSNLLR